MAAQCGPFVSSNVYHGYVQTPVAPNNAQMQQQQQRNNNQNQNQQQQQQHAGMEVDSDVPDKNQFHHQANQTMIAAADAAEAQEQRARKRGFDALPQDFDYEAYVVPRFKRFREEAVVTNVFSMVQGTGSGPHQMSMDWPRCTMSHYYA